MLLRALPKDGAFTSMTTQGDKSMYPAVRSGWKPLSLVAVAALAACGGSGDGPAYKYSAEIRRTEMGIPHIKAKDWQGLGYGAGYAQAQDNLCTMADSFLTYRGERSRYFGGDAQAVYDSTIDRPRNIDSDFFFRHVVSDDAVAAMIQAQPDKLRQLVDGFVAGYNRVVRETTAGAKANAACAGQPWVQAITAQDIWRRMYTANLAGGYSNFVAQIANAVPPASAAATMASAKPARPRAAATQLAALKPGQVVAPSFQVGGTTGIGSNMYGFGQQATGGSSVLFGNPHWYWKGPDRFYQSQLTIPGEIDVSGASFLGIPMVLIGFNNDVAWSHTVSTARRFGLFMYQLAPNDPTRYVRDGKTEAMQASKITLYKTVHGPLVNLGAMDPALGWTTQSVFAIRDINAYNYLRSSRLRLGHCTNLSLG
jgi:acyl-homoserine-lactone acylase